MLLVAAVSLVDTINIHTVTWSVIDVTAMSLVQCRRQSMKWMKMKLSALQLQQMQLSFAGVENVDTPDLAG